MTDDLAAEGDLLHAAAVPQPVQVGPFERWAYHNWPAIAAALRERDTWKASVDYWRGECGRYMTERDALRVRAETAEADADRLAKILTPGFSRAQRADALAAHAAAVEARP